MVKERTLLPDKKNAPKKTGKRGIKPLDPEADFNNPVNKKAIKDAVAELDKPKKQQGSLLVEQPPKPKVVDGLMEAFFLKPHYAMVKGKSTVALAFSIVLEKEHSALLPKIVADGYHDVTKRGRDFIRLKNIPGQFVQIYYAPHLKDAILQLDAAKVIAASVALIERKGEGSARRVIRFAFRLQVLQSDDVSKFGDTNLGHTFWLKLEETQADLFDEGDEQ